MSEIAPSPIEARTIPDAQNPAPEPVPSKKSGRSSRTLKKIKNKFREEIMSLGTEVNATQSKFVQKCNKLAKKLKIAKKQEETKEEVIEAPAEAIEETTPEPVTEEATEAVEEPSATEEASVEEPAPADEAAEDAKEEIAEEPVIVEEEQEQEPSAEEQPKRRTLAGFLKRARSKKTAKFSDAPAEIIPAPSEDETATEEATEEQTREAAQEVEQVAGITCASFSFLDGHKNAEQEDPKVENAIVSGWLSRQGAILKWWYERYVAVVSEEDGSKTLVYYRPRNIHKAAGSISLGADTAVEVLDGGSKSFAFKVTSVGKSLILAAPNQETLDQWLAALAPAASEEAAQEE